MEHGKAVHILLRISIASVFLYAAIAATIQPFNWVGFIPQVFVQFAPIGTLLLGFSVFQALLALWILSGWKAFYAAAFASITLLGIIIANWGDINILFRDFAIFLQLLL